MQADHAQQLPWPLLLYDVTIFSILTINAVSRLCLCLDRLIITLSPYLRAVLEQDPWYW